MDDRNLMENMLILEKSACDLYLHGAIESSSANVHSAFTGALNDSLKMQDEIYLKMQAKGWYPGEQADQNKINGVKQKFSTNA